MTSITPQQQERLDRDGWTPIASTPETREASYAAHDRWTESLVRMANDPSDPETQANARQLLTNRGLGW